MKCFECLGRAEKHYIGRIFMSCYQIYNIGYYYELFYLKKDKYLVIC